MTAMNDRIALLLELLSGLGSVQTTLAVADWCRVLAVLDPTDARIVVCRLMHCMTFEAIAERINGSTEFTFKRWRRAVATLRGNREVERLYL
jgi:hypothetical protein